MSRRSWILVARYGFRSHTVTAGKPRRSKRSWSNRPGPTEGGRGRGVGADLHADGDVVAEVADDEGDDLPCEEAEGAHRDEGPEEDERRVLHPAPSIPRQGGQGRNGGRLTLEVAMWGMP